VNYDNSLVVIITVTCYSWAPPNGDHLFTCGAMYLPPQLAIIGANYPGSSCPGGCCPDTMLRYDKKTPEIVNCLKVDPDFLSY